MTEIEVLYRFKRKSKARAFFKKVASSDWVMCPEQFSADRYHYVRLFQTEASPIGPAAAALVKLARNGELVSAIQPHAASPSGKSASTCCVGVANKKLTFGDLLIPASIREATVWHICTIAQRLRDQGKPAWYVRGYIMYQYSLAIWQHLPAWAYWLGGLVAGWLIPRADRQ